MQEYTKLTKGAEGCPAGMEITTVDECKKAIESLGLRADPPWSAAYTELPRHCSVRETVSKESPERMHFNTATSGKGRADLTPVCKKTKVFAYAGGGSATSIGEILGQAAEKLLKSSQTQETKAAKKADAKTASAEASSKLSELSLQTQEKLLGDDQWCVVYAKEGRITSDEEDMLLRVEEMFAEKLAEQNIPMRWMWLDLRAERAMKTLLEPPALPSALVLKAGSSPKYVFAQHQEQDDEPLSVTEEAIILLVNTVLGGDARFTRLQPKKLAAAWSTKRSW